MLIVINNFEEKRTKSYYKLIVTTLKIFTLWETRMGFLVQTWLLEPFGESPSGWRVCLFYS